MGMDIKARPGQGYQEKLDPGIKKDPEIGDVKIKDNDPPIGETGEKAPEDSKPEDSKDDKTQSKAGKQQQQQQQQQPDSPAPETDWQGFLEWLENLNNEFHGHEVMIPQHVQYIKGATQQNKDTSKAFNETKNDGLSAYFGNENEKTEVNITRSADGSPPEFTIKTLPQNDVQSAPETAAQNDEIKVSAGNRQTAQPKNQLKADDALQIALGFCQVKEFAQFGIELDVGEGTDPRDVAMLVAASEQAGLHVVNKEALGIQSHNLAASNELIRKAMGKMPAPLQAIAKAKTPAMIEDILRTQTPEQISNTLGLSEKKGKIEKILDKFKRAAKKNNASPSPAAQAQEGLKEFDKADTAQKALDAIKKILSLHDTAHNAGALDSAEELLLLAKSKIHEAKQKFPQETETLNNALANIQGAPTLTEKVSTGPVAAAG